MAQLLHSLLLVLLSISTSALLISSQRPVYGQINLKLKPSKLSALEFVRIRSFSYSSSVLFAAEPGSSLNNDGETREGESTPSLPMALPAIGASSYNNRAKSQSESQQIRISSNLSNIAFVSRKFQIQYTCKICGTRNSHRVTRLAYREGVVIAQCKSCLNRHWIADHLGWSKHTEGGFDIDNGERDIEQYMHNKHLHAKESEEESDLVMRVTREVFDLETALHSTPEESNEQSVEKDDSGDQDETWS